MNKKYTKAVIFDMDGVLVDSEPIYFKMEKEIFSHFKVILSKEEHEGFVGTSLENMWDRIIKDKNVEGEREDILNYHKDYVIEHMKDLSDISATKNVKEFIKDLKERGIKIGLASSSPKHLIEVILNRLDIKGFFEVIVSGEEVEQSKPNPEIFLKASKLLNVEPDRCVVIEDSGNGVKAAKSAGMKCIGFLNLNSGNQNLESADIIIKEFPGKSFNIVV